MTEPEPAVDLAEQNAASTNGETDPQPGRRRVDPRRQRRLKILLPFLIVVAFLTYAFMPPPVVPTESMEPTLKPGDHIATMRKWLAYFGNRVPARGDILVFDLPFDKLPRDEQPKNPRSSTNGGLPSLVFPLPPGEVLVKRVVGLPGETIQVIGGVAYINGKRLSEPYHTIPCDPDLDPGYQYATVEPYKIGPDEVFMLGDNRRNSEDSRVWGPLKRARIIGKCVGVLYNEGADGRNVRDARAADMQSGDR